MKLYRFKISKNTFQEVNNENTIMNNKNIPVEKDFNNDDDDLGNDIYRNIDK